MRRTCGKASKEIQAYLDGIGCIVHSDHPYDRCTIKLLERKGRGVELRWHFRVNVIVLVALERMFLAVTM